MDKLLPKRESQEPKTVPMDSLLEKGAKPVTDSISIYDNKERKVKKYPNTVNMDELSTYLTGQETKIEPKTPPQIADSARITSPSQDVEKIIPELFTPKEGTKYFFERTISSVIEKPAWALMSLAYRGLRGFWNFSNSIRPNYEIEKGLREKTKGFLSKAIDYYSQPEKYGVWTPKAETKKAQFRQANYQKNFALGIAGDLVESGTDLMSLFLQMGSVRAASAVTGTTKLGLGKDLSSIYKSLGRLGSFGFLTREGKVTDRAKNALTLIGYNITPYIANATGATGLGAVTVDTMLNTFLTSPTYMEAYKQSKGFNKEFIATAIPQFVMDVGMAWRTRGLPQNVRNKMITNYMNGRMKDTGLPAKEGVELIGKMQEQIKAGEKQTIKGQVEKSLRQETREKRQAIEPIEREVERRVTEAKPQAQGEEAKGEIKPIPEPQRREVLEKIDKIKRTQIYKKDGTFRANYKEGLKKVEKLQQNLEEFTSQKKLRQRIHAYKAVKDMSNAELTRIIKKRTGKTKLTHEDLMVKDLEKVLDSVKRTRPKYIDHKRVITPKTERKIKQAKDTMLKKGEMTEKDFEDILDVYNVDYLGYRSKTTFMTEKQGKDVLRDMVYLSPIIKERSKSQQSLEKNPALKVSYNKIDSHFKNKYKDRLARVNGLLDMHHFADSMEKQTGLPFGFMWERFNSSRLQTEKEVDQRLDQLPKLVGEKEFKSLSTNEQSLDRIEEYIASKLPEYVRRKPVEPKDITKEEKKIADFIINDFKNFEWMVRYNRFYEWYEKGERIPNAPQKELNKGADILESKGDQALRDWLKTRSWGVIKTGYTPAQVLSHKVRAFKTKAALSKKGLRARETKQYKKPEKDILKRYYSYVRGMFNRTNLKPEVNAWTTLFNNNTDAFYDKEKMQIYIQRNLKEMLGQREPAIGYEKLFQGVYGQAMKAVFLDPRKGLRNLFQNLAFYTSVEDALKMKPLTGKDKEYYDTQVSQSSGIKKDWLYADVNWIKTLQKSDSIINKVVGKGLTPLDKLNMMADAVNVMGRTDDINRSVAFRMKLGSVRRAIKAFPNYKNDVNTFNKMMQKAGIGDLTLMETKHAIREFSLGGEDAFARYVAKASTQKVHFLYERAQREPMAQGNELSRILTNLLTFRKGYLQRLALDFQKFGDKELTKTFGMRKRATRSIIGATVGAAFVGALYQVITGDKRNPYRADYIIQGLSLGGLATGAQEQIGEFGYMMHKAALGDERAKNKLPYLISRTADTFIPFFDDYINLMETLQDTQDYDQQIIDKARELIQKRYRARPKAYWREQRSLIEKGQHALFGTEKE